MYICNVASPLSSAIHHYISFIAYKSGLGELWFRRLRLHYILNDFLSVWVHGENVINYSWKPPDRRECTGPGQIKQYLFTTTCNSNSGTTKGLSPSSHSAALFKGQRYNAISLLIKGAFCGRGDKRLPAAAIINRNVNPVNKVRRRKHANKIPGNVYFCVRRALIRIRELSASWKESTFRTHCSGLADSEFYYLLPPHQRWDPI